MTIECGQRLLDEIDHAIDEEQDPARRERVRGNLNDILESIAELHLVAVP